MKNLLNRRSGLLANGTAHLVPVTREDAPVAADEEATGATRATVHLPATSETVRPVTTLRPVPVVPSQVNGRAVLMADSAEVEWLASEEALQPFRVFRSFDYSVSLLFHAKELTYYIALYQDNSLWRALKTVELETAESVFHHFEEQAARLADGETRRAQLEAQNEQLARAIAQSEQQAERLRNDLQRGSAQEQTVSNRQHQIRKEVAQLEAQRVAAQAQLNKAHRQIHQLNLTNNEVLPHLPSNR
ncbi:hypothetical protein BWP39_24790 [Paraburkholderia acidicola]|uniref:DUF2968 domain-containing protein n=1 Tax=Paraburkholderia acidicola TaxID=1912599 RepID=A0A2A4EMM0_9BURK|nr:DUF2968 domain-containing protein [Paraburkholderia acidicola]PCE22903.1 hypothetical protein BWP39_24790 [Paraburkholderia acidicola]